MSFRSFAQDSSDISTTDTLVNILFSNGLYESGRIILEKEKAKNRDTYYEKYCCLDAGVISDLKAKANELRKKGRWNEAIEKYEGHIKVYPEDPQSYLQCLDEIAKIWREQKEYDKAINIYYQQRSFIWRLKETMNGVPCSITADMWSRIFLAETYEEKGLYSKAFDEYELLIAAFKAPGIQKKYFSEEVKKGVDEKVKEWSAKIKKLELLKDKAP